jgi:tRNA (guanine10-N2)-methyltransferase
LIFILAHEEFRLPELESLAKIENVKISYNKDEYKNDVSYINFLIN